MKGVDQLIDGDQAVFFRDVGKMSITCGGCGTGMAKQCLDMTKA